MQSIAVAATGNSALL